MSPPRSGPRTPRRPPSGPPPSLRLKGAAVCRPRGQLGGGCSPARPTRHAARAALRGTRVTRRAPAALSPSGPGRVSRSDGGQTRPVCSAEDLGRARTPPGPAPLLTRVPPTSSASPGHRPCPGPPPGWRPWGQPWSSPPAGLQRGAGGADRQGGPRARRHPPWSRRPGSLSPTRGSYGRHRPPHPASGVTDAAIGLCDRPVHQAVGRRQRARRLLQRFTRCRFSETPSRGHARHAPTRGRTGHRPLPPGPRARARLW